MKWWAKQKHVLPTLHGCATSIASDFVELFGRVAEGRFKVEDSISFHIIYLKRLMC